MFLVALGIDYNIFLMTRVREETADHGTRKGSLIALALHRRRDHVGRARAGGDVPGARRRCRSCSWPSSASRSRSGVLLDTIIVRSVLVTALNLDLGGKIWWPSKLDPAGAMADPDAEPSRSARAVPCTDD